MRRFTDAPISLTLIAASMALAFGACTTGQPRAARINTSYVQPDTSGRVLYMEPVEPTARTVISKNYAVGSRRVASVDEPMVGVQDYTSSDLVVAAVATRDFVQHCRTPEDLAPQERAATAAAAPEPQAVDPRASAEVPSGGFAHEPEAYGASGTSESAGTASMVATADAAPKAERESHVGRFFHRVFGREDAAASAQSTTVRERAPQEERDLAEPLTPRTAGQLDSESDSESEARADGAVNAVAVADPLACQSGRLSYIHGKQGDRFPVAGAFEAAGKRYYLLEIPTPNGTMYIAVDALGRLKYDPYLAWHELDDTAATRFGVPLEYQNASVAMGEKGRLFRFETTETVSVHGGAYRNFELVYKGTTYDHRGMVYHVLYKEYGRDRPTVPIFIQDLAYASQTDTVDILGMRIRVHDVDDSQISYTVQRD